MTIPAEKFERRISIYEENIPQGRLRSREIKAFTMSHRVPRLHTKLTGVHDLFEDVRVFDLHYDLHNRERN
ncbi:hypothetical protein TNCV_3239641 [Trichonephila clavipes]|nr:hypothetical protein TNCV_3239641 [Trichonephila clavipes]